MTNESCILLIIALVVLAYNIGRVEGYKKTINKIKRMTEEEYELFRKIVADKRE